MFSRFHRRTPSNPTSPAETPHSWSDTSLPHLDHAHPQRSRDGPSPEPTTATSPPSFLPPIERVSSGPLESTMEYTGGASRMRTYSQDSRSQQLETANSQSGPREIHTFSNHQRIPYSGQQRPESAGQAAPLRNTSPQFTRTLGETSHEVPVRPKLQDVGYSFVTAADLQLRSPPTAGRRATGVRLTSPPTVPEKLTSAPEPVTQAPRSGKARLNLLNPMSLLARRRTAQNVPQLVPEAVVSSRTRTNYMETFDPRIRGTVVHDFSAPRPRRNVSHNDVQQAANGGAGQYQYQRSPNPQAPKSATTDENPGGPWSGGNHTPVFTENFEEEQYPAAGPHVRKTNDVELPLPKPPYAKGVQRPPQINTKSTEGVERKPLPNEQSSAQSSDSEHPPPVPPKAAHRPVSSTPKRISIDPSSTPPKSTASTKKGRMRNLSEVSAKDAAILGLPKHMKSTSSRFSFDMIGAAEQERLLEDRHRQKALEKKTSNTGNDAYDDVDDGYDYDNMDDDDGLEERIPGVNADLDEEDYPEDLEESIPGVNADLDDEMASELNGDSMLVGFKFQSSAFGTPAIQDSPAVAETPRDSNGEVIGFAMTKNSPHMSNNVAQAFNAQRVHSANRASRTVESEATGLGLVGVEEGRPSRLEPPAENEEENAFPKPSMLDDDDLYFDDGIIQDEDIDDAAEFDESVFDNLDTDEYGRPLKAFSSIPTLYSPPNISTDLSPQLKLTVECDKAGGSPVEARQDTTSRNSVPTTSSLLPLPSTSATLRTSQPQTQDLTQSTLAAYQSALAAAAHAAAANGKFRRDSIPSSPNPIDPQPSLIPDTSQHTSAHFEPFSPSYDFSQQDDFDYDDALSDDPIIAAANAEALANDCDGFYGQEFGFYSAPAAVEAQYANGGYFGPRGAEGVIRSQSGRVVSREPNLTPITERSEYSNRNSFMSIPGIQFGSNSAANLSSPGLSQLAGLMSASDYDYDGDMTLNSLLKLRRGAWGGSQASLHSSNGNGSPREGNSPAAGLSPLVSSQLGVSAGYTAAGSGSSGFGIHRRKNSNFSVVSETLSESEENDTRPQSAMSSSTPQSPTLMMRGYGGASGFTGPQASFKSDDGVAASTDDRDRDGDRKVRRHRHTGSAESISYLKEGDPVSGERWILERRRTAESGEVELLAREVVSGGRI